jgi:predicted HTH domain antitoxin
MWQTRSVSEVKLTIPDETFVALKTSPDTMGAELQLAAAMKLYELGRLSAGAAAQLAGLPKPVFLAKLADYGIDSFRESAEELAEEAANA